MMSGCPNLFYLFICIFYSLFQLQDCFHFSLLSTKAVHGLLQICSLAVSNIFPLNIICVIVRYFHEFFPARPLDFLELIFKYIRYVEYDGNQYPRCTDRTGFLINDQWGETYSINMPGDELHNQGLTPYSEYLILHIMWLFY